MKYLAQYEFEDIIKWLPFEEQGIATAEFLLTGNCYIERTERPHVFPEYRLVRPVRHVRIKRWSPVKG